MAEQPKQHHGRPHSDAPSATPTTEVQEPEVQTVETVATEIMMPTPVVRAKLFVRSSLAFFDSDQPVIARQVSQLVTDTLSACPSQDRASFVSEGKQRAERLKQFAELLYNEFVYQSAATK